MTEVKKDQHVPNSAADKPKKSKASTDADLNDALEDSFPASDPPSMTRPDTEVGSPHDKQKSDDIKR